jgi:hypothetical protein
VVAGCGSERSETASQRTETLPRKEQAEAKVEPRVEPRVEPKPEEKDPEKQAFIKLIQQNADDPSNLEIVVWGGKKNGKRTVRFRCAKIGENVHQGRVFSIMLDNAQVEYDGDQIKQVRLERAGHIMGNTLINLWRPQ